MKLNIILFALFSIQIGLAQERTINGTVFSEGKPLNGASLRIKGSNLGTITNENGDFLIKFFEKRNNQLIISFIGHKSKQIEIDKKKSNLHFKNICYDDEKILIEGDTRVFLP